MGSRQITALLLVVVLAGPALCQGTKIQDVIQHVGSWARDRLAAWGHIAVPELEGGGPRCLNAEGAPVDWWVAIKPPGANDILYIDSQHPTADAAKWRFSLVSGSSDMPIERTLQQLHSGPGRVEHGHVMYSDDAPQAEGMLASELSNGPFTWGKGVLGLGSSSGFWITHSVPAYPAPPGNSYSPGFPERVQQQAHSLLCVSAAAEQLHSLAGTLQSNAYNVYSLALPEDIHAWSGESLAAAAALLLGNPAESEEDDDIWPDVIMNEVTSIEGERFVVLSKNGSRSEEDEVDSILESFYGSSMLRTSPNWPKPRASSTSGYSAFQPRELRDGGSGLAWNASADRSHWRISFSEGQAPVACQGGLWDPDLDSNGYDGSAQPPWNAGSAQLLEQAERRDELQEEEALSSGLQTIMEGVSAIDNVEQDGDETAQGQPMRSQTMTAPVTSASRRLLDRGDTWEYDPAKPRRALSEFITFGTEGFARPLRALAHGLAHRLLGSPEMAASLSMRRRSVLSVRASQEALHGKRPVVDWLLVHLQPLMTIFRGGHSAGKEQALFQPQDDSFPSAASDILATRDAASQEQQAAAEKALAVQQEVEEGLRMELKLTGASSVLPEQVRQSAEDTDAEDAEDREEGCSGEMGAIEQLKCRAQSLQQQVDALEEDIDRLEVVAEAETAQRDMEALVIASTPSTEWMYGESGDGKGAADGRDEQTAGQEGPCKVAANGGALPVEKHAVCFNDRGRSPEANKLPGGAVCFGGHAGLWHALRALVQTYEFCN